MMLIAVWAFSIILTMLMEYKNEPSRPYIRRLSTAFFVRYLRRNVANTAGKRVKLFIR
jgi:hypothetical protein